MGIWQDSNPVRCVMHLPQVYRNRVLDFVMQQDHTETFVVIPTPNVVVHYPDIHLPPVA